MNHTFTVTVSSPLLRPGISVSFQVSGKYLVPAIKDAIDKVREINVPPPNQGD